MGMIITAKGTEEPYNVPLYGLNGAFTLSPGVSLPYFVAVMPIDRALDELRVAEEMTPSLDNSWSLKELYQREVDQDRVKKEIVDGYLKDPRKLKFFNGVTVVLMPKSDGKLVDSFSQTSTGDPPIPWITNSDDDRWQEPAKTGKVNFGGVQFVRAGVSARLRWNANSVHAAVVDGQHRIVALRQFRGKDMSRELKPEQKQTGIVVVFLLLDPVAGLSYHSDSPDKSIKLISREIFTDLNKHARPVDEARELILDDLSVSARCVRDLVTDTVTEDLDDHIPLALVRWQEPTFRFDDKYYLTSLVLLQVLVDTAIQLPRIKNPSESKEARQYIEAATRNLGNDVQLSDGEQTLLEVYEQGFCDDEGNQQIPFSRLPAGFLPAALEGFRALHRPWIMALLTTFRPYARVLQYARAHNLISGEFGQYFSQIKAHQAVIREEKSTPAGDHWYRRTIQNHIDEIEKIKGIRPERTEGADWAFKTNFIKPLFLLTREIAFETKGNDPNRGDLRDFIGFLNTAHEEGLFRVKEPLEGTSFAVWNFIATNPGGGNIKVSAQTEKQISRLIRIWYYSLRRRILDRAEGRSQRSAAELVKFFAAKTSDPEWPGSTDAIEGLSKAFERKKGFFGPEIDELSEPKQKSMIRSHLHALVRIAMTRVDPESGDLTGS
jgi:hypothetical protein